jgi:hypothetical protein
LIFTDLKAYWNSCGIRAPEERVIKIQGSTGRKIESNGIKNKKIFFKFNFSFENNK